MTNDVSKKIHDLIAIGQICDDLHAAKQQIVHCHGCFDLVHPGHVRHLNFAAQQGDKLIVTLTSDDAIEKEDGTRPYIPQELRAENLAALACVDHVVISDATTANSLINAIKPSIYIKGTEYEGSSHPGFLEEKKLVEANGGRVLYSSGEVVYSSTRLLEMFGEDDESRFVNDKMQALCERWAINRGSMRDLMSQFTNKRVAVIGDTVLDRYIFCEATDCANEAPMLSVKPLYEADYPGAAAIIASHLTGMGAKVDLLTTLADDAEADILKTMLSEKAVNLHSWDAHQKTPMKIRYLSDEQKLFKVDRAEHRPLDTTEQAAVIGRISEIADDVDAIIFSDFGYGMLSPNFVTEAIAASREKVNFITGDISGARATLLAYQNVDLLAPTERELRSVIGQYEKSLPTVVQPVMKQLNVQNMIITMNKRGCVLFRPREEDPSEWFKHRLRGDHLPAFSKRAMDPVGAGDAMIAIATLAMCSGATLPQAGYLASGAAAIEVDHMGNHALRYDALSYWLDQRNEL